MYPAGKRLFDLLVAAFGIVLISPVLVAVGLAVKLSSPGPVLYRGERVGQHGRGFRILKFRTMHPYAELVSTTTAKNDPRITRLGRILRTYKLDELPQLINVVKGEMSLVGPRPEVEEHTSAYDEHEQIILSVPPGITDYSSLHFFDLSSALGSDNAHEVYLTRVRAVKNQLRIRYVQNRSFIEDLRIVVLTILALGRSLRGRNT